MAEKKRIEITGEMVRDAYIGPGRSAGIDHPTSWQRDVASALTKKLNARWESKANKFGNAAACDGEYRIRIYGADSELLVGRELNRVTEQLVDFLNEHEFKFEE